MREYSKVTPEIAERIRSVVGEGRFYQGAGLDPCFGHDEMPIYGEFLPEAAVDAETTEEISEIMKICNEARVPVTCRGAGTGLVGGSVPLAGGVVICTRRMNRILSYDMDNLAVRLQPGVLLKDLAADAQTHGLMYPPDPGEKTSTVGGNISTNAGGMRAVKYGVTRDYVLALTVVLADGRILELGKSVSKSSSGYSLLHLMIGSEGTLGIITEMTLKLIPNPICDVSCLVPFRDVEACISFVPRIKLANLDPQSIEFMDADIVTSSSAFTGIPTFPERVKEADVGASLLVTFVGADEDELDQKMIRLGQLAEEAGALDVLVVATSSNKKAAWAARSSFLTAIEAETKLVDEMDVVVPVDKIPAFLLYVRGVGEKMGIRIQNFGHAGDGNLHIYCCSNELEVEDFKARVKVIMDKAYARCAELEGQVSGEHSIGHAKMKYLRESIGEDAFGLMREIKSVFDPNNILNPGKVCDCSLAG
ncbi:MAG: FAD-binding protein [Oscillospiraceae bacterium]|nr:FAD-binding protein [Oscillospiraceae bacterium]